MKDHLARLIERYPQLAPALPEISLALKLFAESFRSGNKLLVCGNGGSAADAEHIVGELMKAFAKERPLSPQDLARFRDVAGEDGMALASQLEGALPAIALTSQLSLNTAVGNDNGFEMVFAQQVFGLGQPGDALLGISTSGNSRNVVNAMIAAKALGLRTVALTGGSGGRLASLAEVTVRVPGDSVAEIQELHLPVYHAWCLALEERFFNP